MARVTRLSQWVDANSVSELMRRWHLGGDSRSTLAYDIGYISNGEGNVTGLYNQMVKDGYIVSGTGERKSTGTGSRLKVRGCLPNRIMWAVAKILNLDLEDHGDITYTDWKEAIEIQGDAWVDFLFNKLGGRDSEAGNEFAMWCDSNHALELAEIERIARESDPTFLLKAQVKNLREQLSAKDEKIADLESDLRSARIASRSSNGGTVTAAMRKLMQQRFHPDKQNGNDPALYTAIAQFINAIVTTD